MSPSSKPACHLRVERARRFALGPAGQHTTGRPGPIIPPLDREQAWNVIHERLPPGWRVGPPTYSPATRRWEVAAIGPKLGGRHGPPPTTVIGVGVDELAALRDLAERLP